MVPADTGPTPIDFTDEEIEILSQAEHERWMRNLGAGWRHGTSTDKPRKISEAYLPWDELAEEQKDKDRNLVREIPTIMRQAGYAIVRTCHPDQESA